MRKIPVKIAPSFFVMAALLGFLNSYSLIGTIIWMFVIFISVLFHEYGHATFATLFGQRAQIQLFAFGGLTLPQGKKLKGWQEFLVIAMGPGFGFLLYFAASLIPLSWFAGMGAVGGYLSYTVVVTRFINLFWTVINLIPILPLDGGHLLRVVLSGFIGHKAWKVSFVISFVLALAGCLFFFAIKQYFIGIVFLLFTFQSAETLRQFRNFTKDDENGNIKGQMEEAQKQLQHGDLEGAKKCLENLLSSTSHGMIHTLAVENLAKIAFHEDNKEKAYELLKGEEKYLSAEGKILFYQVCFYQKDYDRVIKLSGKIFELERTSEIAIIAAKAMSQEEKAKESVAWLTAAKVFGEADLKEILGNAAFDKIRESKEFQKFITKNG
ncbi:site-2 protease family protein [bacterium]|nr:site-2 protease family protein [bacterium]